MAETIIPPWIIPDKEEIEDLDEGTIPFKPKFGPGLVQRQSFGDPIIKVTRVHKRVRQEELGVLIAALKKAKGRTNAMRSTLRLPRRGSFPSTEMIPELLTGWSSNATDQLNASVGDRVMRVYRARGGSTAATIRSPGSTGVLYAPYVARAHVSTTKGMSPRLLLRDTSSAVTYGQSTSINEPGMMTIAAVPYDTDIQIGLQDVETSAFANDFYDVTWASFSRCALVDNGLNMLLQSDNFDNASWSKSNATIAANVIAAPDGTLTADALEENATSAFHIVSQTPAAISSSALDYSFGVALRAGTRSWARVAIREATGATEAISYINLSTGVLGTSSTGANWANTRVFVISLGNDWYACYIVARKTNSATSMSALITPATGDGIGSYAGVAGDDAIYMWRATLAQSSVPTRLIATTTTASTGTSQTGNALYLKGLPESMTGLLLRGDAIEINSEVKQVTASLDSNAGGLGYLEFEPALFRSPSNDDPIIITNPCGKFLVSNLKIDNEFGLYAHVSYDLEHVYE